MEHSRSIYEWETIHHEQHSPPDLVLGHDIGFDRDRGDFSIVLDNSCCWVDAGYWSDRGSSIPGSLGRPKRDIVRGTKMGKPVYALSSDALKNELKAISGCWELLKPLSTQSRDRVCEWLREWVAAEHPADESGGF